MHMHLVFFFRIGGEQSGEPIIVPKEGRIFFGISAESKLRSFVSEVWVYFDPGEVDLSKTKGAEKRTTVKLHYPIALYFSGTRVVKDKIFQGFFWEHQAISSKFTLKFIAYGQIDETETPFHDMFPA